MSILSVRQLAKEFPTRAEPLKILQDVNFELESGRNMAILGPSGSGKSTLLYAIGTLDAPTGGTILLDEQDPYQLNAFDLAAFRNHHIGFIFQDHHLLPQLSVLENVLVPVLAEGAVDPATYQRAEHLLERVNLVDRTEHRPAELSGGERGRVAIARALIRQPAIVLADEPTGNLDRHTADDVSRLLLQMQQDENTMLIVVTHSQALADCMQTQMELVDGSLVQCEDRG